jgi:hypothetical protein
MDNRKPKAKRLSDSRFSYIIFLFRVAGIPLKMKKISVMYAIYMITVILCTCTTYLGMLLDVYVNRNDLGHAMTATRMVIPFTNMIWIYFYYRYVETLSIIVAVPYFEQIRTQKYYRSYYLKGTLFIQHIHSCFLD